MDTDNWKILDDNPTYWIVDDMYNDEAYQYMEFVDPAACTDSWLRDVTATLGRFPEWGIGVNSLHNGYLLIFAHKLLVKGSLFRGCRDAARITQAIRVQSVR
jgi:hypothetical protein